MESVQLPTTNSKSVMAGDWRRELCVTVGVKIRVVPPM